MTRILKGTGHSYSVQLQRISKILQLGSETGNEEGAGGSAIVESHEQGKIYNGLSPAFLLLVSASMQDLGNLLEHTRLWLVQWALFIGIHHDATSFALLATVGPGVATAPGVFAGGTLKLSPNTVFPIDMGFFSKKII